MKIQWRNTFVQWNNGVYYFRVVGYGLYLPRYSLWPPLFSEREGYEKVWRLSKDWRVKLLVPR